MKSEIIKSLTGNFENHSQTTENGIEFWFARDIQHLLGYSEWRNFKNLIFRAKNIIIHKHSKGVIMKTKREVEIGSGAKREIIDFEIDKNALLIVEELSNSYKLNNYFSIRNETIVLQLVEKYCKGKNIRFSFQYKIGDYFFDCMINDDILIEFDEPHHSSNRQKNIDLNKDQFALSNNYRVLRVDLEMDIIDIILFIEEYV